MTFLFLKIESEFTSCSEIKFEEAAVLHYTYTKFSDLTSRRDRCGCKPTKEDVKRCFMLEFDRAVRTWHLLCWGSQQCTIFGTSFKKRFFWRFCAYYPGFCAVLQAFIIASTASQEEMRRWYMFHQLLSIYHFVRNQVSQRLSHFHTGNFIQCLYVKYRYKEHVVWTDKELNLKLMRKGLLTRIYAPQVKKHPSPPCIYIYSASLILQLCCFFICNCLWFQTPTCRWRGSDG